LTASGAAPGPGPGPAPAAPLLPLPQPDPATQPYWDSLRAHAMRLPWCLTCDRAFFYPRPHCPRCLGAVLEWRPVGGRGTLYSFTVVHRAPPPQPAAPGTAGTATGPWAGAVPYVVALVDLEEGVRLMANLVGVAPDAATLRIGAPLELEYADVSPEVTLPRFRPALGAQGPEGGR
jgi:uncharacterized OB-fold protein